MSPWDFPLPAAAHRLALSARASTTPTPWDRGVMRELEKLKTMDTSSLASSAPARRTADLSKRFTIRQMTPRASHSSVSLSTQGAPLSARSSELLSQDEDDAIWAHISKLETEGKGVAAAALTARLLERHHKRQSTEDAQPAAEAPKSTPPPTSSSNGGSWYRQMVAQACENELARELDRHAEVEAIAAAVSASAMTTASAAAKDAVAEAAAAVAASAAAVQAAADATAAEAAAAADYAANRGVPLLPLPEGGESAAISIAAAVTGSGRSAGGSDGSRGLPTANIKGVAATSYTAAGGALEASTSTSGRKTKIGKILRQPASRNLRKLLPVPAPSSEWWALRRAAPPQARV